MNDSSRRLRAAALVRVSTDQQADKGGSIADQEKRITAWCKTHNYELVATYGHDDRSGGQLDTSPDFVRMLDDAETGSFDAVVVESIDRFRRNIVDALVARKRLREAGTKLHIISFGDADMTLDEGAGLWLFTFGSAQAQAERESFKQRGAKAHRTKVARGQWNGGWQPTGYLSTPGEAERTRTLTKDPAYEEHIAFLWDALLAGWPTHRIARELTARGCKPPRGGERFSQPSVSNMARSPIYAGHNWAYDDDGKKLLGQLGMKGDWEPYVSPEQWIETQQLTRARRNNHSHRYMGRPSKSFLLAGGIALCGTCGQKLWVRKDAYSDYYACSSIKTDQPCGMPRLAREKVDLAVRKYIVHGPQLMDVAEALDRAYDYIEREQEVSAKQTSKLEKKLAQIDRDLQRLEARALDDDLEALYRAKRRLRTATAEQLEATQAAAEPLGSARPTKRAARRLLDEYRAQFENDAQLGLEDLQARIRDHVQYVVVKRIPQPQAAYDYDDITWRNDPASIAVRFHWQEAFVEGLVRDVDPTWLAMIASGKSDGTAC